MATMAVASLSLAQSHPAPVRKDVVDTAVAAGSFKTLVAAVKAAGLVDALKADGSLTVFAPTDAAFQKLEKKSPGTIAMLLKPENKDKLVAILKYHVVPGKFTAKDIVRSRNGSMFPTLNGEKLTIKNGNGVVINQSKVVKADIGCTNGVIHVIDTVLLPQ